MVNHSLLPPTNVRSTLYGLVTLTPHRYARYVLVELRLAYRALRALSRFIVYAQNMCVMLYQYGYRLDKCRTGKHLSWQLEQHPT